MMIQLRLVSTNNLVTPVSKVMVFSRCVQQVGARYTEISTDLWLGTDWKDTTKRQRRKAAQHISKLNKVPSYMRKLKQEGDKKGVKGLRLWTENKLSMTVFKKKKNSKIQHIQKFMNRSYIQSVIFFSLF